MFACPVTPSNHDDDDAADDYLDLHLNVSINVCTFDTNLCRIGFVLVFLRR